MKRISLAVLSLSVLFLLFGCSTTANLVSGPSVDPTLSLEQKMEYYDIPKVSITYPVVYHNGNEWRDRVMELISSAQDYVIISSFLASSSTELEELYAAITQKSKEGVAIYFIVDGTGAFDMTETRFHLIPLKFLRDSGVHLLEYNPFAVGRIISGPKMFFRDHRKFLIVDGKNLALGGMNLNYISVGASDQHLQRDTMYEFASPQLCEIMLDSFVPWWNAESWEEVDREDFTVDPTFGADLPHYDAWYADQYPLSDKLGGFYGSLLSEAEHSVNVLPFLPFFDQYLLQAFSSTAKRGVAVHMIIPFDSRESNRKGIEYMAKDLLTMGIDLRIENEGATSQRLLHEKLMIIDDRYVVFGSSNMNYRSFSLSFEVSMVIDSPELAQQMNEHFRSIYETSAPITEEMADSWRTLDSWPRYAFGMIGG